MHVENTSVLPHGRPMPVVSLRPIFLLVLYHRGEGTIRAVVWREAKQKYLIDIIFSPALARIFLERYTEYRTLL